ncbi:MAG: hypothetical protein ACOZE7_17905 [Pseudomonadota bacterium]
MTFKTMEDVSDRSAYVNNLKKALDKLEDNALGDFDFFDGVDFGGTEQSVLLVGSYKDALAKELKTKAKSRGTGTCFRQGKILNLTLSGGKMPEARLKTIFKETKNFGFQMVEATMQQPETKNGASSEEAKVRYFIGSLESTFDKFKGAIGDDNRKALRIQFGKIDDALKTSKWGEARKVAEGLEKAMTNFIKQIDPHHGKEDSRAKANATQRWKDTMGRFDKAKGQITDGERVDIRKLWGTAEDKLKAGDWAGTVTALEAIDKAVVNAVKLALKDAQQRESSEQDKIKSDMSGEAQLLVTKLTQQGVKLESLRQALLLQMKEIEPIRKELQLEKAKEEPDQPTLVNIKERLDAKQQILDSAKKALVLQRKDMEKTEGEIKAQNLLKHKDTMERLERTRSAIASLENVLQSTPISLAREELQATVKKMDDATQWRKERLKVEASGKSHATSRHGAQTGFERQARRAATAENVLPDHKDNPSGSAQVIEWNQVKFTYTVGKDGKREFKDRKVLATKLANIATQQDKQVTDTASMWATPVLEKESFDLAISHANKLKQFTLYKNTKNEWKPFTSATLIVKKSPGWGYAIKRTGAHVSMVDAEAVLRDFEHGRIDLDEMFKRLNTELLAEDGGAKMIPFAVVVLRRASVTDDWALLTQYPANGKKAVKWEPVRGWPKNSVEMRETSNGPITTVATNALP